MSPFDSIAFCGLGWITKSTEHNLLFSNQCRAIPGQSARAWREMIIFTLPGFARCKLDDRVDGDYGESFVFDLQRALGYHRWSASGVRACWKILTQAQNLHSFPLQRQDSFSSCYRPLLQLALIVRHVSLTTQIFDHRLTGEIREEKLCSASIKRTFGFNQSSSYDS